MRWISRARLHLRSLPGVVAFQRLAQAVGAADHRRARGAGRAAGSTAVARELAALQGCQRGSLAPSTLHLFWDLFGMMAGPRWAIFMDEGLYPIGRWGVERAAGRGVPVTWFPHHDPAALLRRLDQLPARRRPVVVADGLCPGCGGAAPIADYLQIVRARGGLLILDDTQALGILGHSPGPHNPYGRGGGGSLRHCGARWPRGDLDQLTGQGLRRADGPDLRCRQRHR